VSKEVVLELLKQDAAQHIRMHQHDDDIDLHDDNDDVLLPSSSSLLSQQDCDDPILTSDGHLLKVSGSGSVEITQEDSNICPEEKLSFEEDADVATTAAAYGTKSVNSNTTNMPSHNDVFNGNDDGPGSGVSESKEVMPSEENNNDDDRKNINKINHDKKALEAGTVQTSLRKQSTSSEEGPGANNPSPTAAEVAAADGDKNNKKNAIQEQESQPLVGYWYWEHSLRSHRMKMHVAKGADLALHVVMAIVVNQVRFERNAIATAI
jgi:hypothetical protein